MRYCPVPVVVAARPWVLSGKNGGIIQVVDNASGIKIGSKLYYLINVPYSGKITFFGHCAATRKKENNFVSDCSLHRLVKSFRQMASTRWQQSFVRLLSLGTSVADAVDRAERT
jgi:hypothetical protein